MDTRRDDLLKRISALDFMTIDLNLYLDTHPNDEVVLMKFNKAVCMSKQLKDLYESMYEPLCTNRPNPSNLWQWIKNPWPWEYEFNYFLPEERR